MSNIKSTISKFSKKELQHAITLILNRSSTQELKEVIQLASARMKEEATDDRNRSKGRLQTELQLREEKLECLRKKVGERIEYLKKIAFEFRDLIMKGDEILRREEEIVRKEEILEKNKKRMQAEWKKVTQMRRMYERMNERDLCQKRKKPRYEERREMPTNDDKFNFVRSFFAPLSDNY